MNCEDDIDAAVAAVEVERELCEGDAGGCGGCLTVPAVLLILLAAALILWPQI